MRHRPPAGPPADSDPAISALLADLDESIAGFEEKLRQYEATPARPAPAEPAATDPVPADPATARENPLAAATETACAPEPAAASLSPPPSPAGGDLLSELAHAASRRDAAQRSAQASDLALRQRFHVALRTAFDYLHQLVQHLNVLHPPLPVPYTAGRNATFADPCWQHGTVDYRTGSGTEIALVNSVVLRATLAAVAPPALICADAQTPALRHELSLLNLKVRDETAAPTPGHTAFSLMPEIYLQLHFAADLATQRVVLRARNLGGFGLAAYALAPEALTRTVLDDIGRCLIGRQRQMPPALVPQPFSFVQEYKGNP